ncbi:hypothetical protein Gasu_49190 isoform 1 [Galdieria sulphuraria]|uniref:Uncharacterized protein n=1 Tax=Galdieria sulphuraria TaxID=130081 RepID=M2XUZ9_GALSU|nr:hypothetical protein Gasu_49190 isoform 1 [Galdieria sulphuraria]EME27468.1 hypothetical protein Gasu_49190 isoform 1 [Galdieria sulphuraria]|eukprot:XP_005703988.1 hypothetical protein isoform 1 [Galdieria sulphuraria]
MAILFKSWSGVPRRNLHSNHRCDSIGQCTLSKLPMTTFIPNLFLPHQKRLDGHRRTKRNSLLPLLGTRRVKTTNIPFSNISLKKAEILATFDTETTVTAVNYGQIFLGGISIAVGSLLAAVLTGIIANSRYEELEKEVLEDEE